MPSTRKVRIRHTFNAFVPRALLAVGLGLATLPSCETTTGGTNAGRAEPVVPVPPPPPEPTPEELFADRDLVPYTVQPGDTLWEIGQAYKVSVTDLRKANKLEKDLIFPEQQIVIPVPKGATPALTPGTTTIAPTTTDASLSVPAPVTTLPTADGGTIAVPPPPPPPDSGTLAPPPPPSSEDEEVGPEQ